MQSNEILAVVDSVSTEKGLEKDLIFTAIEDKAVSIKSSKKISDLINKSTLYFYEGDHYFFIKQSKYISLQIENDIF